MRGQMSNCPEIGIFQFYKSISPKPLTVSKWNLHYRVTSLHYHILFWHLDEIFMMYSIPEGNNAALFGKIARGQTWRMALIDIRDAKGVLKTGLKNEPRIRSQNLRRSSKPPTTNCATIGKYLVGQGQWPWMAFERSRCNVTYQIWSCFDLNHT